MNFTHTEDRRMLADSLTRYLAEQYPIETRHAIVRMPKGYDPAKWAQFAELGAIGALFPESQGGFGGAGFDIAVVFEALGGALVVEPFLATVLGGSALGHAGNAAQQALLAQAIAGEAIVTLAHEERNAHYAPHHVETTATREGDAWVLNGLKSAVPSGDSADHLVVSARTAGNVSDEAGISLFVVPAGAAGLSVQGKPNIDGTRGAEVRLANVRLPADALLGTAGDGLATLTYAIGRGLVALCAESLGAMEVAKRATIDYLQTRKQFGTVIGRFQALQHRMATVLLEIEQARSAVTNAAAALDGDDAKRRERMLSAAKYSIGQIGARVAEESIQLHGGIGMTWELPMPHYAKRLVMIDHQLGDEDHHLARFIALSH